MYKENGNFVVGNTSIVYDYGSAKLKCIGVTQVDGSNYNVATVPYIPDLANHKVTINTSLLTTGSYAYFAFYFDVLTSPTTDEYIAAKISAAATSSTCSVNYTASTTNSITIYPYSLTTCNYSGNAKSYVNNPDIRNSELYAVCSNFSCGSYQSFQVQVDNSFKGALKPSYTNNFTYELNIGKDVDLQYIYLYNDSYMVAHTANGGTVAVKYKVFDDNTLYTLNMDIIKGTWIGKGEFSKIPLKGRLSYVQFIFSSFSTSDLMSARMSFQYGLSNPVGFPTSVPADKQIVSNVVYDGNTLKTKTFTIPVLTGTTCTGKYLDDYLEINNSFSKGYQYLDPKDQDTKVLMLRLDYIGDLGQTNAYHFDYNIRQDLLLPEDDNNIEFKFYYGDGGNVFAVNGYNLFLDEAAFEAATGFDPAFHASIDRNAGRIRVSGIKLPSNLCGGGSSKQLFVAFNVKMNKHAAANYYNYCNPGYIDGAPDYDYVYNSMYWTVPGESYYLLEMNASCDTTIGNKKVNLTPGDDFTYHYFVKNTGNDILNNITSVGVLPHAQDRTILTNVSRGTSNKLQVSCPAKSDFKFVVTDFNGDVDLLNVASSSDFTIEYALVDASSSKCLLSTLGAPKPAGCADISWQNTCPAGSGQIALKISTNTFKLTAFNTLDIQIKGTLPSSAVVGQKLVNDFSAKVTDSRQITLNLSASNLNTITVAKKSDCYICLDCDSICKECVPSFSPLSDERYLLSAWVKEDYSAQYPDTYLHSAVKITFNYGSIVLPLMRPSGPIIDGWQRIEQDFMVPAGAKNIQIILVNDDAVGDVFFDDVRIHPFKSNMKSFVYNPSTQKLVAELDENNYSTQYEYDDEGILIRVKKETERGVMTIKESRNNQSKLNK
ncbi:MAG: hypothetical protein NT150_01870 [Bacteroidetes bacterium]|nr:hypothetical protein [Bacteroidota bacterium]